LGSRPRIALALLLLLAPGLFAACDAGSAGASGPPSPSAEPEFALVAFQQEGAWDVRRDQALVLRFSDEVDPAAASGQAVRVVRRGSSAESPVTIEVQGDTLMLHPPAPFGFDADARYNVELSGFPSLRALTNRQGRPLAADFLGVFGTSRYYGPDLVSPTVQAVDLVEESGAHWSLRVLFSEPVNFSTVSAAGGVTVLTFPDDEPIPGRFIQDRTATSFQFLPDLSTRPQAVRVLLLRSVLDLAGNPLDPRGHSDTVLELSLAPTDSATRELTEDFTDTLMMDAGGTTALWGHPSAPGALLGRPRSSILDLLEASPGAAAAVPFGSTEVKIRMLVSREELGVARQITGLVWTPAYGGTVPGVYEHLEVRITPARRDRLDQPGVDLGPPVTVLREEPYLVPASAGGQISVHFAQAFSFDGESDLLLEASIGTGTRTNRIRAAEDASGRSEVRWGREGAPLRPAIGLRSYSLLPVATSRFYDTGLASPEFFHPVLNPATMPEGVRFTLTFQGTRALDQNGRIPANDPGACSDWVEDITTLSGCRYVRFRATFAGTGQNGEAPFLDTLLVPFRARR
jgi:hypothetical protein